MKKKQFRHPLNILLSFIIILLLTGCTIHFPRLGIRESPEQPQTQVTSPLQESALPSYEHYDPSAFYENCSTMLELYHSGSSGEAFDFYTSLENELTHLRDLMSIALIIYSEDVSNTKNSKEYQYTKEVLTKGTDRLLSAGHEMITGQSKDEFRAFLNNETKASVLETYQPMTDEQEKMLSKETELTRKYQEKKQDLNRIRCSVKGKTYYMKDILNEAYAADLLQQDTELYYEIFEACVSKYNRMVGDIFLRLVKLRTKIAESYGFDNYAEYMDEAVYVRAYSPEDLDGFKNIIKYYAPRYQPYIGMFSDHLSFDCGTGEDLMKEAGPVFSSISPLAGEAFDDCSTKRLYSIGENAERMKNSFTVDLPEAGMPFIFMTVGHTAKDPFTLTHEFGHYTASLNNNAGSLIHYKEPCLDLAETHSQALELLFTEKNESVMGEEAKYMNANKISLIADTVIKGCIYDDWQRKVYADPDMTLEEVNQCFQDTAEEYSLTTYPGYRYLWCDTSHNFETPMYYISYSIGGVGALQIWSECRTDYDKAAGIWEALIREGVYADYFETMEKAGLKPFTDTDTADHLLDDTLYFLVQALYTYDFS